jgi:hypothetical protein
VSSASAAADALQCGWRSKTTISRGSRTESFPITARQGRTEVTLHIVQGRLHELEIWAGGYGVRPRVDVTKLEYASG